MKKVSLAVTLLGIFFLVSAFLVAELAEANPTSFAPKLPQITIQKDGSVIIESEEGINSSTDIIKQDGNVYHLTRDLDGSYCISIGCNNIVFDGDGHSISDSNKYRTALGITIYYADNVVIRNVAVHGFYEGIGLYESDNSVIDHVTVSNNGEGIHLLTSKFNQITNCSILNNIVGIGIYFSGSNNTLLDNILVNNQNSIKLSNCQNNTISRNVIKNSQLAIYFEYVKQLNSKNNHVPAYNTIYSNNFIDNSQQISMKLIENTSTITETTYPNIWSQNGKGNYWSNYNGTDAKGDGIGDTPYNLTKDNLDQLPLMQLLNLGNENKKAQINSEEHYLSIVAIGIAAVLVSVATVILYKWKTKKRRASSQSTSPQ